jgi:hypothetical protein
MRDETFTNLGSSAEAVMSLIESLQGVPGAPSFTPVA